MAKLIGLDEAAALLGMTSDEVTEARTKNQLFGYRDGVNWKFKENELERFAASKGITLGAPPENRPDSSGSLPKIAAVDEDLTELVDVSELELSEADDDQDSGDPDSILVSEEDTFVMASLKTKVTYKEITEFVNEVMKATKEEEPERPVKKTKPVAKPQA